LNWGRRKIISFVKPKISKADETHEISQPTLAFGQALVPAITEKDEGFIFNGSSRAKEVSCAKELSS
jgi:hypothetical protein